MKTLHPKVTIVLPVELLKEVKEQARATGVDISSLVAFCLYRSLKDSSFSLDLKLSEEYLDKQLDF